MHDCDFLDEIEALRQWFGFRLYRNPFLLPHACFEGIDEWTSEEVDSVPKKISLFHRSDRSDIAEFGRKPWEGAFHVPMRDDPALMTPKTKKRTVLGRRKGSYSVSTNNLAPYAVSIVNDPCLLPKATPHKAEASTLGKGTLDNRKTGKPAGGFLDCAGLMPNQVSKEDVLRMLAASQVLADEEDRVERSSAMSSAMSSAASSASSSRMGAQDEAAGGIHNRPPTCQAVETTRRQRSSPRKSGVEHPASICRITEPRRIPWTAENATRALNDTDRTDSLTRATAALLQRPHPQPHPGLGPVLVRSNDLDCDRHSKLFLHTVSKPPSNYPSRSAPGPPPKANMWIDPFERPRLRSHAAAQAPLGHTDDKLNGSQLVELPRELSPSARTRPSSAPQQPPSGSPDTKEAHRRFSHDLGRKQACRASRKTGIELMNLTAAGTTGRRNPPPREIRLRRLAREVARRTVALRKLERAEEMLRVRLQHLEQRASEAWVNEPGEQRGGADLGVQVKRVKAKPDAGLLYREGARDQSPVAVDQLRRNAEPGVLKDKEALESDSLRKRKGFVPLTDGDGGGGSDADAGSDAYDEKDEECLILPDVDEEARGEAVAASRHLRFLLEQKRREIESEAFDLGIKRDELALLRSAQKEEHEKDKALELERRRIRLPDGKVS